MSFPNVIYLNYGDEKVAQSTKIGGNPIGQLMILPDGRKFRLSQADSSAALIAGVVVGGGAETAGHGNVSGSGLLASATTTENKSGDTAVYIISQSAAILKDHFAEGELNVLGPAGSSAYAGRLYKVKANESAAVSSRFKVTLEPYDSLKADAKAGTTLHSLRVNPYARQVIYASGTGAPMGVVPTAVSASFYFWVQRSGDASCWQSATVVTDGAPVQADTATAGSVTAFGAASASTNAWDRIPLGIARGAGAASQAVIVDLRLE